MASIFDVFGRLLLDDDKKFQQQAKASAEKAGDAAGTTMGQRMSAKLGTALKVGLVGVGTAGGALFGIAAKGGAELTASVAAFRAETGATAEEAEAAQGSIARLYSNNINGFEELGAVLASVKTNLGLTGAEGEAAAQRILDFAKVTGQDAVGATEAFDDLLDSLNLSYEEGSGLLDQLVASHQKYGGSVEANQAALATLAPALNAANLSVDDGVGLLNLFAASGIDAAAAPAALTKALTKVKSPEELQKLIADISATEDPFERAQKAADLFGAKAGAKLANALDGTDFGTFTIGAEEAAGAIEEASDVIDNEPFTKLKLALKNVAGPLAEVGSSFGPLVLGFSQLGGPKLIGGITAGLGGIAGKVLPGLITSIGGLLPAVTGALGTLGSAMGGIIAAAIPVGMALLPVLLVGAIVAAVIFLVNNPEIVDSILAFVNDVLKWIGDFLGKLPELLLNVFSAAFGLLAQAVPALLGGIVDAIGKLPGLVWDILLNLARLWLTIHERILGFVRQALSGVVALFLSIPGRVAAWVAGLARQAGAGAQRVLATITTMVQQVVSFILSIPGKVAAWVTSIATQAGQLASTLLSRIQSLVGSIVRFFLSIPGRIASLGGRIVSGIIGGLASLPGRLADTIRNAFRNLRIDIGPFHISSSGISIDLPKIDIPHFAAGGRPPLGRVSLIGEEGPELWVPDSPGTILPAGSFSQAVASDSGGQRVYAPQLVVQGALPVRTIRDVSLEMQRIDREGKTPARLLAPMFKRAEAG